jgi:hypothetical protein
MGGGQGPPEVSGWAIPWRVGWEVGQTTRRGETAAGQTVLVISEATGRREIARAPTDPFRNVA